MEKRKGMLLVISGPSGVGKSTLLDHLMNTEPSFRFSVSATTRAIRKGEIPDVSYHYVSDAEFDRLIAEDAFLEWANVHGNRYGTLKSEVLSRLESGQDVLLDVDVQGALSVQQKMPDCVTVFIAPPSYSALRARLEARKTDAPEVIERRLAAARGEIALMPRYQYAIINDVREVAAARLVDIVRAEKQNLSRYTVTVEE